MSTLLVIAALIVPVVATAEPTLLLEDPAVMADLEKRGLSLHVRLGAKGPNNTVELYKQSRWSDVARVLSADLARIKRSDARAGPSLRYAHRLFDARWLRSETTRFELVAVVNRLDRQVFAPQKCGETRLIYRLAYTKSVGDTTVHSRLPITVNLVYWQQRSAGQDHCAAAAKRWIVPANQANAGAAIATLLGAQGPLSGMALHQGNLKSLEVNIQSVRWPSTVHPSLGGHAEYIMRVFKPSKGRLVTAALENTPDVRRLKSKRHLKKELLAWLTNPAHFKALDEGTAVLPERFLAKRSDSVTPRGLARLANRPFRQLFRPGDFDKVDFSSGRFIKSSAGLLRRLDGRTCAGCHQSRSVAGFHIPGDDPATMKVDALAHGHSDHFEQDLKRRARFNMAMPKGKADPARGLSERLESEGVHGSRCGLGDASFAAWTCGSGLVCKRLEDDELGVCVADKVAQVGEPCQVGSIRSRAQGHRDRVRGVRQWPCGPGRVCEVNSVGFPNGMCAGGCASGGPHSTCGVIAILTPFNRCLGKNKPFPTCITENVRPAALRRCSKTAPCRDDYVCARMADGAGACIPPYFLFQLRVDGH